jgi:hypothetical protein
MGDARGHWEGPTLVVEKTNFRECSVYRNADPRTLRLVERFTRVAPGKIDWSVMVDDATTWTGRGSGPVSNLLSRLQVSVSPEIFPPEIAHPFPLSD